MHVELYGSLGATGKGHGSDKAVLLGLAGHEPDTVDVDAVPALLAQIAQQRRLRCWAARGRLRREGDLKFHRRETLPFHANGMRFAAFDGDGSRSGERAYYSVGGGFVVSDEAADGAGRCVAPDTAVLPHPSTAAADCWSARRAAAAASPR